MPWYSSIFRRHYPITGNGHIFFKRAIWKAQVILECPLHPLYGEFDHLLSGQRPHPSWWAVFHIKLVVDDSGVVLTVNDWVVWCIQGECYAATWCTLFYVSLCDVFLHSFIICTHTSECTKVKWSSPRLHSLTFFVQHLHATISYCESAHAARCQPVRASMQIH